MHKTVVLLLLAILPGCLQTGSGARDSGSYENPYASGGRDRGLHDGTVIVQGSFGAAVYEEVQRSGGSDPTDANSGGGLKQVPMIAANWQTVLGGDRIDYGIEAGVGLGFRSDRAFVAVGGGNVLVAVDVDLWLFDLSAGPFLSINLGKKARVYGAVGPLMQFANYSHDSEGDGFDLDDTGSGFGLGWYSRLGVEMAISRGMMVGIGARWIDSRVDLSSNMGDLDIKGLQTLVTFSTGF